ncbi:MAG: MgtC/SapB family protein [Bacteriovoracaceae bacterium]
MTETINIEIIGETPLYVAMGIKVVCSMFLGALLGIEREAKMKAAGIKTNMLICLGSCIYVAISTLMLDGYVNADPNRIAAQVVSGIGFLGAGAILKGNSGVSGITSAASVWVAAAIGLSVGFGYVFMATFFTITVLSVYAIIDPLYRFFQRDKFFFIEVVTRPECSQNVIDMLMTLAKGHIKIVSSSTLTNGKTLIQFETFMCPKSMKDLTSRLSDFYQIQNINSVWLRGRKSFSESDEDENVESKAS